MAWPYTASAACMSASGSVGCGWMVRMISSVVDSSRRARQASEMRSVTCGPDHVDAQDLVVLGLGDDLHEAEVLADDARLGDVAEGEAAHLDVVAALLGLRLGEADAGDLRHAVGGRGHAVVVDRLDVLAGQALGHADALCGGHVGELRMRAALHA